MYIYFLRHAIAAESGQFKNDADRPLTDEGVKKMQKAAKGMKRLNLGIDRVISSPYVRARQTAEIAAAALGLDKDIQFDDSLTPDAMVSDFLKLLGKIPSNATPLLVGHEPTMSLFIAALVSRSGDTALEMKKGGLSLIRLSQLTRGGGTLEWLVPPGLLRELA